MLSKLMAAGSRRDRGMATQGQSLHFDVFTLDLSRYVVLRGEEELPLRPKAFDMLRYLAEHAGRVVTKDELFEAVWGGAVRSDDTLVQCVKHIRQTLGERGHHVIKAVPRRGYMFIAQLSRPTARPDDTVEDEQKAAPASRRAAGSGWHRAYALAAALIPTAGIAAWILWGRPEVLPPHAQASHYAILARAILDQEHSAKANKEALALLDKALGTDPNSVNALLTYARVMLADITDGWSPRDERKLRLKQAETAIERAIALDPKQARAYHLRGFLWRVRGDPDRAIAEYQRTLALEPNHAWAHADMGRSKIDVGRSDEAIGDIEMAIQLNPNEPRLFNWYYWAGMAAVHAGMSDRALEWLAKQREPNKLFDRFAGPWLAVAYADVGREEEGRSLIAAHLERVPSFTLATFTHDFPHRNRAVADQRVRIAAVLRRLGVPESQKQAHLPE